MKRLAVAIVVLVLLSPGPVRAVWLYYPLILSPGSKAMTLHLRGFVTDGTSPASQLEITANEGLDDVVAKLWIVRKREPGLERVRARGCRLSPIDYAVATTAPDFGIELSLGHLSKGETVRFEILWEHPRSDRPRDHDLPASGPVYAALLVSSRQGDTNAEWHRSGTVPPYFHYRDFQRMAGSPLEYEIVRLAPAGNELCRQL